VWEKEIGNCPALYMCLAEYPHRDNGIFDWGYEARFEPDANLNGRGANFICGLMLALRGVLPFIFVEGKIQRSGFA
jgi:hypothetical protein